MNRIALITGGSRGLGRAAALALAARGTDVVLTFHGNAAGAEAVVAEVQARGARAAALQLDVTARAAFPDFAERLRAALAGWGREDFDILLNNAGTGATAAIVDTDKVLFDRMLDEHFRGVYFLTRTLLPLVADGGDILNVSSGLTRFTLPGYSAYAAMKGAVEVFSRYLAKELGPRRIRVNTLAPGAIATDFGGGAVRDDAALNGAIAGQTALGRVGEADDIGGVVAALLEPGARWINAQRVEAAGGAFI